MSRGHGLHRLTGGIAKRECEQWQRLRAGWPCALRACEEQGVALIFDWTGTGRPVCASHLEGARAAGLTPVLPPTENGR